jgi:LysR family transcriptional regulator, regulator of abg operon
MRLSQLRDFIAVVQNGSLRAAARAVGISQPAITKSIRQLEEELHVQLLQRNARGALSTPAGTAFLARAKAVESELRKMQEDLHAFRGGADGSVAFGIAPQTCMLVVPQALQQFRQRYASARVRVVEGVPTGLLPLVREGTLDFLVGMGPTRALDSAIRFKPLFRPPLVVVGRQGHPLRNARSLQELAAAQWLMYYPIGTGAMLEKAFAAAGQPLPRGIVQCESYATALALLTQTDTLGLLIPQMISRPYGFGQFEQIRIREALPAPLVGLYARADAPMTPAAAAMAQAVTASARRLARM